MVVIEDFGKILIVSIFIIVFVLILLILLEKKVNKKGVKRNRNLFYLLEIKEIDESDPKKILNSLDRIARNFFKEAFKLKSFSGYSELRKFFTERKDTESAKFCELMNETLYSKEKDIYEIQRLTSLLINIIKANKIILEEE